MLTQNTDAYMLAIVPPNPALQQLLNAKSKIKNYLVEPTTSMQPYLKLTPTFYWNNKEEFLLVHEVKNIIANCFSTLVELTKFCLNQQEQKILVEITPNQELVEISNLFNLNLLQQTPAQKQKFGVVLANGDLKTGCLQSAFNSIKNQKIQTQFNADKIKLFAKVNNQWVDKYTFDLD